MAQTGYTPIQLYYSSTTTNAPLAANLASGELAINITDGKLFYKDNANAVQVIGWKVVPATAGGTGQTSYAVGDLIYADTTTTLAKLPDVATGNALISGGVSTAPSWGKIGLTTHVSGILPLANGGTNNTTGASTAVTSNATSGVMQITGPAASSTRVMTIPDANFTVARTDTSQTFTGNQTFSDDVTANVFHGQTKTFTNLSTSYVDVYTGNTAYTATYLIRMDSVAGCTCTFLLALSYQSGLGIITTATNLSGCVAGNNPGTVVMAPDDTRTYTFIRDGGTGNLQIKASSLATGTTTLRIVRFF